MSGLGKLIKYEMKAVGRIMLPVYGAFIVISILFGISLRIGTGGRSEIVRAAATTTVFQTVMGVVYVLAAVAVVVFTLVILIQRFYRNLLGNEGYLCFSMPVSVNAHITNKVFSAGLWVFFGAVCGALSAGIISMAFVSPKEIIDNLAQVVGGVVDVVGVFKAVLLVIEVVILAVMMAGEAGLKIYAAISLGQLWSGHRVAGAVFSYLGFSACESLISGLVFKVVPSDVFYISQGSDFMRAEGTLGMFALLTAVLLLVYWIVTDRLLERHLNLQ